MREQAEQYIWVGIRESDIAGTNGLFSGSITLFGSGDQGNISMERRQGRRIDHNGDCQGYLEFYQEAIRLALETYPQCRFVPYDALDCVELPSGLRDRFMCCNNHGLLSFLNDKIASKQWAAQYTDVLPHVFVPAAECNKSRLAQLFPGQKTIVVQRRESCGGLGTFFADTSSAGNGTLIPVSEDELCIVTPYIENSLSVNIHACIYQDEVVLFAPSLQIIDHGGFCLAYMGADFSAYRTLSSDEQRLVTEAAEKICGALRTKGYRGICGVDFLLADGKCYFMEINGRFQASSAALNRDLARQTHPSLQHYHMDAFSNAVSSLPTPPPLAEGSFYTYHYHRLQEDQLRWLWNKLRTVTGFFACDDHLRWEDTLDDGCYVFQLQSPRAISSVTYQHSLRLHPNVSLSPFLLDSSNEFSNLIRVKALLLSRGVDITPRAWSTAQSSGGVDWEEFGSVTMRVYGKYWFTVPCREPWHSLSPLCLDISDRNAELVLSYYGAPLFPVDLLPEDSDGKLQTAKGHRLNEIAYLSPDRLRIYHRNGCALQNAGMGCKFCDLYGAESSFEYDEIVEAVSHYLDHPRVRHYMIGGGSSLVEGEYNNIIRIASYLRRHDEKHIYLMCRPIQDRKILCDLHMAGVTEIAFNIEMFNRDLARQIMPGKAKNSLEDYFSALKNAVSIWGRNGNVRSVLLLGFDDLALFASGVRQLCEIGVAPILSLFRPCAGTPLEGYISLDEVAVLAYYETAERICGEFGMKLGPSCKACQSNTVALDM